MFLSNLRLETYLFLFLILFIFQVPEIVLGIIPQIAYFDFNFRLLGRRLVILTIWINLLILISPISTFTQKPRALLLANLFLLIVLVRTFFGSQKLIPFYILFELSLIPIFFIIIGWGYQVERLKARLIFIFYTILASLPLLTVIILLVFNYSLFSFIIIENLFIKRNDVISQWVLIILILAFLVKVPIFLFHSWLPKAHTEAPVIGSIVLAAILLKLGTYGVYVLIIVIINYNRLNWVFRIRILGGVAISLVCIQLTDLKRIIAYSSVAHMSIILVAIRIFQSWGTLGGVFIILAHGFTSSGLFLSVNIIYERSHRRSLIFNKGLIYPLSRFIIFWFLLIICNIAAPPTLNLFSEILIILRIVNMHYRRIFFIFFIIIFGSGYSLIIFRTINQGKRKILRNTQTINLGEFIGLWNHLLWRFLLILRVNVFI